MRETFPPNFPLAEFLKSERATRLGIANVPEPEHEKALAALAWAVLQPLRDHFGQPIPVSSGYRSPKLNAKTPNASTTSQHSRGEAVDLDMKRAENPTITNADLFHYIRLHLPFDQLIWEHGTKTEPSWVHVSFSRRRQRNMLLRATKNPKTGKNRYPVWTP